MNILIVEDDARVADFLERGLRAEGYRVQVARNGTDGLDKARDVAQQMRNDATPAVLVLDVMLPGMTGLEVCQTLRAGGVQLPILMLSALGALEDRVAGLRLGADDYLAKPFSFQELLARLRAITRRPPAEPKTTLVAADLELDIARREVRRAGRPIELTAKEFALLELLLRKKGLVVTRGMILDRVWNMDYDGGSNLVEVYINYLRRKVDQDFEPKLIQTVRGMGYVLETPESR